MTNNPNDISSEIVIDAKNIYKSYRHNEVLKDISLQIKKGDRLGIVGPNGTGKTTLCEILAHIRRPSKGKAFKPYGIRIGMQLQESKYPKGITTTDMLNLYLKTYRLLINPEIISNLINRLGITPYLNKDISKLSGGQQQKINILLALIINPDVIILDELGTGLDLEVKDTIYNLIDDFLSQPEKSLILISHNMDEIQRFCKNLLFMVHGEIIHNIAITEILTKSENVEAYVKQQFKEYQVGAANNDYAAGGTNDKWTKSWTKYIEKKKK